MSFTYVVPDIHGRVDLLCDGFTSIFNQAEGRAGMIIMLGDYVSKGPRFEESNRDPTAIASSGRMAVFSA